MSHADGRDSSAEERPFYVPPSSVDTPATNGKPGGSSPSIGAAMRRHPLFVLGPIAALLILALLAGVARTPTYTASTRLAVGGLNATNPASFSGFADAAQQLAQTYSRSVQGDGVVGEVAQRTGLSRSEVRSHLSAASIPETAVFSLKATSGSPDEAVRLSNLASAALVREVELASEANPARLLEEYRAAEVARQQLSDQVSAQSQAGGSSLAAAQAQLLAAEARTTSLRNAYEASQQSGTVPLQVIQKADTASGDGFTRIQILSFVAIVVGLILGMALALFRDSASYPGTIEALGGLRRALGRLLRASGRLCGRALGLLRGRGTPERKARRRAAPSARSNRSQRAGRRRSTRGASN
jgi:capsular polysaccharide biosynthesis protein